MNYGFNFELLLLSNYSNNENIDTVPNSIKESKAINSSFI